ncbi:unnamed protein product [Dibothriocephalus latus]|uniref:Uncharacterized protein n=1 Tax=Dibothriocephalus latus TaxID=60516 RepID=A0A3P7LUH3_DIBLA|nr:unnamed protein product [Dibothriocephalus latus]
MISIQHVGLLILLAAVALAHEVARGQTSAEAAQHRELMAERLMHDQEEGNGVYSRLLEDRSLMDDDAMEEDLADILKRSPHFWKRHPAFWKRSSAFWKRSPAFWKRSNFWKRASFW